MCINKILILPHQILAQPQEMPFLEQPELPQTLCQELEKIQGLDNLQTEELHGKRAFTFIPRFCIAGTPFFFFFTK